MNKEPASSYKIIKNGVDGGSSVQRVRIPARGEGALYSRRELIVGLAEKEEGEDRLGWTPARWWWAAAGPYRIIVKRDEWQVCLHGASK